MKTCRWIGHQVAKGYSVKAACEAAGISRQVYYKGKISFRKKAERDLFDQSVVETIKDIHTKSYGACGYRRISKSLAARGISVSHKKVYCLMKAHNIRGKTFRGKFKTTISSECKVPDLINRDNSFINPFERYCGDIKYIDTKEKRPYFTTCIDIGSRKAVAASIESDMTTRSVKTSVDLANGRLGGFKEGAIYHSNHESQFMDNEFRLTLKEYGLIQSAGSIGSALDNAVAEPFFATIEREFLRNREFETKKEARDAILKWIKWYNT